MKPQPQKKVTLADTKRALHEMMLQDGLAFPETPEDIDRLEAILDDSRLPTPDVNAFIKFLHSKAISSPVKASKLPHFVPAAHFEGLAMAARNGSIIDPETRKRMNEHRTAAEKSKGKLK